MRCDRSIVESLLSLSLENFNNSINYNIKCIDKYISIRSLGWILYKQHFKLVDYGLQHLMDRFYNPISVNQTNALVNDDDNDDDIKC